MKELKWKLFKIVNKDYLYLISTKGSTAGVTGQQRMLTPPWHLILS
jgi:hypothetical protein